MELVVNSRVAIKKLRFFEELGEKIFRNVDICRKLETEKEKVLPFYISTVDAHADVPPDIHSTFNHISAEQYEEYCILNNFNKRYNKVLLDKLAISK